MDTDYAAINRPLTWAQVSQCWTCRLAFGYVPFFRSAALLIRSTPG